MGEIFRPYRFQHCSDCNLHDFHIRANGLGAPIDYEDPFYLVHSPLRPSERLRLSDSMQFGLSRIFANFHPVNHDDWLIDRSIADKIRPFDGLPFRITQLLYAVSAQYC